MSDDRQARAERLLEKISRLPATERRAFLERECEDDPGLRREVEELLPFVREAGADDGFLRSPLPRPSDLEDATSLASTEEGSSAAEPPEKIGPYRLLEKLGEGGMGEVWLAEQSQPVRRRVALKVIKQGMDTRQVVARFEAEKQALALMDHPAIAKVYDAGTTPRGRPYFVMEYVQGVAITKYCDRHRLTNRERLELFKQVCQGVQHAHQKAVIHRDLKPSNVMVSIRDGRPVPKIIDFGVAKATAQKLTAQTIHTQLGVMIGTPTYMSPEQAELTGENIDTRTDVYALGVMLYELLVGALPFDAKEFHEAGLEAMMRKIREVEPPKPSTRLTTLGEHSTDSAKKRRTELPALKRELSGDLDWITMKALEKDRARRYDSPLDLAAEIDRYLTDQPVLACPPSAAYRAKKFVRRHTWGVAAAAASAVVLIAFMATTAIQARRIAAERDVAQRAQADLESVVEFQAGILSETDPARMGRRLIENLSERVVKIHHVGGRSEEQVALSLASLDALIGDVNTTDLALDLVDEEILAAAAERLDEMFGDQPLIEARLRRTIGQTYQNLGLRDRATPQLERAVEIRQRVLGPDDPATLEATQSLAWNYLSLTKLGAAERLFSRTLEARERVLGDDHPATLESMENLATLHRTRDRLAKAEPLLRRALELQRKTLGEDDLGTLSSMVNLGSLYVDMRRFDAAEQLLVPAFESLRRKRGEDDSSTLVAQKNLGRLYHGQGRYGEAESIFREALSRLRRILGNDHWETRRAIGRLAMLYEELGRFDEADSLYPIPNRFAIESDPEVLESYVGRYYESDGFVIAVSREEDRLYVRATGQWRSRLFPESESRFFIRTVDAQLEFIRDAEGTVNKLILYQGGSEYPASRID